MGLKDFARFQQLRRQGHDTFRMGFHVKTGAINSYANRVRLAKAFKGIELDGYSASTVAGYNGFMQVVLTHSALECFMDVHGLVHKTLKNGKETSKSQWSELTELMASYEPQSVVSLFNLNDVDSKFYNFLCSHINDAGLIKNLTSCRDGKLPNISYISASIRHMFAHGFLTAHANGINPKSVNAICISTSNFLLNFIDGEFSKVY